MMSSNKDGWFASLYNVLSKGSELFTSVFVCSDDLMAFFDKMQLCSTKILNDRMKQYDADGSTSIERVGNVLKTIPELNMDDTGP